MAYIRQKGDKRRFWVVGTECLGRTCLRLGEYESRGAVLSGSRATGNTKPCCMTNAYHGCPYTSENKLEPVDENLLAKRKAEGMKASL